MKNGDYILINPPLNYPGKRYRKGYCYEHHFVYWKNTGILPGKKDCIHHKNGDRHDNSFKNLELIDRGKHTTRHNLKNVFILCTCEGCKKEYNVKPYKYNWKKKNKKHFFCSRKCIGKKIGANRKK